jgi:molybdate transport system substrate-binding protein
VNRRIAPAALALVLLLAGCASGPAGPADAGSDELTVFAAASLTGAFEELGAAFAREHSDITLRPIVYDGSSTLATQIAEGANADVFASADAASMRSVTDFLAGAPAVFAKNTLEIAVAPGNPHGIRSLADLAAAGLQVVLCAPQVPCGAAARTLLAKSGVSLTPVSEEQNVAAVMTKVRTGEADAGLVYVTDVLAAGGAVDGIRPAGANSVVNVYPIAVLAGSDDPAGANAFVRWVRSSEGQAILHKYGFAKP